jgi:threonyl-tRNA synthetase
VGRSPKQIRVLPITDAQEVAAGLKTAGLGATVDETPDKLGATFRLARNDRVTSFAVVGEAEVTGGTVALQHQASEKLGTLALADLMARLTAEVAARS